MTKFKNIGVSVAILLFGVLTFSSCASDYNDRSAWEQAYINSVVEVRSDSRGYFEGTYDIDVRSDVYDMRNKLIGPYVSDIDYHTGDIIIKADAPMNRLTLILYRNGYEQSRIDLERIVGNNVDNVFDGQGARNFLYEVAQVLRKDSYADVKYQGLSALDGRSYMDIDIYMDIDAYVRD